MTRKTTTGASHDGVTLNTQLKPRTSLSWERLYNQLKGPIIRALKSNPAGMQLKDLYVVVRVDIGRSRSGHITLNDVLNIAKRCGFRIDGVTNWCYHTPNGLEVITSREDQ